MDRSGTEDMVELHGARLWTATTGQGEPGIVLCHGGPGLSDNLGPVAAMLSDLGTVHRYDQRGGGRSPSDGPFDIATFVEDLDGLRSAWGHERWIVGGHSWGALLALLYAVEHPDRTQAVLSISGGPPPGASMVPAWPGAKAERLTPDEQALADDIGARERAGEPVSDAERRRLTALRWKVDFAHPPPTEDLERDPLYLFPIAEQVRSAMKADVERVMVDPATAAAFRSLDVPVLMIHGEGDPRRWEDAAELTNLLPRSSFVLLQEAGHLPWMEQPEEFSDALRGFLTDLG